MLHVFFFEINGRLLFLVWPKNRRHFVWKAVPWFLTNCMRIKWGSWGVPPGALVHFFTSLVSGGACTHERAREAPPPFHFLPRSTSLQISICSILLDKRGGALCIFLFKMAIAAILNCRVIDDDEYEEEIGGFLRPLWLGGRRRRTCCATGPRRCRRWRQRRGRARPSRRNRFRRRRRRIADHDSTLSCWRRIFHWKRKRKINYCIKQPNANYICTYMIYIFINNKL